MRRPLVLFALVLSCRSAHGTEAGIASPPSASSASDAARPVDRELADMPRDAREGVLASAASAVLGHEHVLARSIDDSISKEAFHRLVDDLDVGKLFLLESDVQKLARFEMDMDDELRAGDLVLGRKAAALLASRRRLVADVVARILAAHAAATRQVEGRPRARPMGRRDHAHPRRHEEGSIARLADEVYGIGS